MSPCTPRLPPESFDEDVVAEASAPVHVDVDSMRAEHTGEILVGELAALVSVEDLGRSLAERFIQGVGTETGIEPADKRHASMQRLVQSITATRYVINIGNVRA
jgi:hypothetical protein